jgi:deoxyribose-phosphate aldolase
LHFAPYIFAFCRLLYDIQISSIKKEWQAAWLLRAVQCIDLTTLAGDDTETNVNRLCFKASLPIREDIITGLGVHECHIGVGAVCVYSARVREACLSLEGTGIPVAGSYWVSFWADTVGAAFG